MSLTERLSDNRPVRGSVATLNLWYQSLDDEDREAARLALNDIAWQSVDLMPVFKEEGMPFASLTTFRKWRREMMEPQP